MKLFFATRTAARTFKADKANKTVVDCGATSAKRWAVQLKKDVK